MEQIKKFWPSCLTIQIRIMEDNPDKLGWTGVLQHQIDTGSAMPIRQHARRVPLPSRETVHHLLQDMLQGCDFVIKKPMGLTFSSGGKEEWVHKILCRLQKST